MTWIPDEEHRYAAIDIGSNGVRLLLSRVIIAGGYSTFTKESLVRMPIRLGADVFLQKSISDVLEHKLVSTMNGFAQLLKAYDPEDYRACATSAMREAKNGKRICERIKEESGLELQIIGGGEEAEIIFAAQVADQLSPENAYLYIDVGGGSTELTFFANQDRVAAKSFPIGTVRMLNRQVTQRSWAEMRDWVIETLGHTRQVQAIGSGGNINKIFRLAGLSTGEPLNYDLLKSIDVELNAHSYEERIRILHLRPDRADVIIPASKIFTSLLEWGHIEQLHVPQFGLSDGLIHVMHDSYLNSVSQSVE